MLRGPLLPANGGCGNSETPSSGRHEPGTEEPGTEEPSKPWHATCQGCSMPGARDHTDFDVWKLSDELRSEVDRLVARRPMRAAPDWCRQLTPAAESACANIPEGFAPYLPADMARFSMTRGSHSEILEHRLGGATAPDEAISTCSQLRPPCASLHEIDHLSRNHESTGRD